VTNPLLNHLRRKLVPWINVSGHDVLKQSDAQSCGYCCIGMVVDLVNGGAKNPESSIIATGRSIDGAGAYDRATKDRVGVVPTMLIAAAEEQYGELPSWGSGTYGDHLARVLTQGFKINAKNYVGQSTGAMKGAIRSVSADTYLIALVLWSGGGGHWVLITGRKTRGLGRASDYTILDPAGEVVTNRGSTTYSPSYGTGQFAGCYVKVTGGTLFATKATGVKVMI
jgi:hypothetical protein